MAEPKIRFSDACSDDQADNAEKVSLRSVIDALDPPDPEPQYFGTISMVVSGSTWLYVNSQNPTFRMSVPVLLRLLWGM